MPPRERSNLPWRVTRDGVQLHSLRLAVLLDTVLLLLYFITL